MAEISSGLVTHFLASNNPSIKRYSLVFFLLFSFPCPSGNSSTETKSANREMLEDEAMTLLVFLMKADRERREI